jgi:CBS domain containing-hemolysin-like protein
MSDSSHSNGRAERGGLFDRLRSIFGAPEPTVREEIEDALADATEGELSTQERSMLRNVLGLHELRVRDVMVPRTDITAIDKSDTLAHVLSLFRTAGHSRLPVYDGSLDAPLGMVHIRDFMELLAKLYESNYRTARAGLAGEKIAQGSIDLSRPLPVAEVMRPVLFVPPSMPVLDLLVRMQSERTHMALVIDEYGGTDGLVSIEDVVEAIVGDIEDEHDIDETPRLEKISEGEYVIDGRANLDEAIAFTGVDFGIAGDKGDVDTIAGFVATIAGHIPETGEVIKLSDDWNFEILEADRRVIKLVKLKQLEGTAASA